MKKGQGSTQDLPCLLVGLGLGILGTLSTAVDVLRVGRPFRGCLFFGDDSIPTAPHCGDLFLRKSLGTCEIYMFFLFGVPDKQLIYI